MIIRLYIDEYYIKKNNHALPAGIYHSVVSFIFKDSIKGKDNAMSIRE